MRMRALERTFSAKLEIPLIIARSDPNRRTILTELEHERLTSFGSERRRKQWLIGRNALKQVLSALSLDDDTCVISFPNARLSLTHSGDIAYAVGTAAVALGIGIDFERPRRMSTKAAHFYLAPREVTWVEGRNDRNAELLRLWTAKEAAYKSYLGNTGKILKDFTILDPSRPVIQATVIGEGARISIASETCADGLIAVSVVSWTRAGSESETP